MANDLTITAVTCVKNEGPFLLEWIAFHQCIGVTDFLFYSNDCDDGTDTLLDALEQLGHVTHLPNPAEGRNYQMEALKAAKKQAVVQNADWVWVADVDEFPNIHAGDHSFAALHAAIPDATAITLTWRLFGAGAQVRYTDAPVLETFTYAAPAVMYWPWRAAMFKTLYRNDGTYRKPGVHRPRDANDKKLATAHWFDGNGAPLPEPFVKKRIFSNFGQDNYGLVQLNHYPLGAMERYVLKADRGRAVHSDDMLGVDYWVERNFNTDQDLSIQSMAPVRAAELAALKSDTVLAQLHADAVHWRKARFEQLMQKEPFRALFGRLMMTPPSQPVPRKVAQFMVQFANMACQEAK